MDQYVKKTSRNAPVAQIFLSMEKIHIRDSRGQHMPYKLSSGADPCVLSILHKYYSFQNDWTVYMRQLKNAFPGDA